MKRDCQMRPYIPPIARPHLYLAPRVAHVPRATNYRGKENGLPSFSALGGFHLPTGAA
jgi:hypothetical protein